ncbi:Tripeptidyl-peptidase sed2 [Elasticomyces elasticus]|nr:Tripeptidyl-peptidase sed2 [Elasticomyces elasticus]
MRGTFFTGLLALAASGHAGVLETVHSTPEGWTEIGRPSPSTRMHFRIAMTHPNEGLLEQTLYEISDPSHERYGKHLGRDELKGMLRPEAHATDAVLKWLADSGLDDADIKSDGEWVNFVARLDTAEQMLDTQFHVYHNAMSNTEKIRTLSYSIPDELHELVTMVQPTTRFGQMRPQGRRVFDTEIMGSARGKLGGAAASGLNVTACNASITPSCLKELYNVKGYSLNNASSGFAAFNNFLEEYPRYSDLKTFEAEYAPYANGESFSWSSINGGLLKQNDTIDDSGEANLDVQYLLSMGYPVPIHAYSTGGRGPIVPDLDQLNAATAQNEPYLDFLTYILAQPDDELPHTLTTSYGEDEQSVPLAYRKTVCNMFGQLGARGVSVLFSSGDTGVGSACQTNDGKNTTRFLPIFPAACPFVTSVGGTYHIPEQAIAFSSGGFSDTWARPRYQNKAVSEYLSILGDRWDGLYNKTGRGFPDVAAQSYHFHVIDQGQESLLSGTSASSPAFAGIIAILNGLRIQAGKPTLGFLNPWIYSTAYKALNDVVLGGSRGCTGEDIYSGLPTPFVPYASWNATPGWDPVTGYGTPDFQKLMALALNTTVGHHWKA